jgi:hypothetical protein
MIIDSSSLINAGRGAHLEKQQPATAKRDGLFCLCFVLFMNAAAAPTIFPCF